MMSLYLKNIKTTEQTKIFVFVNCSFLGDSTLLASSHTYIQAGEQMASGLRRNSVTNNGNPSLIVRKYTRLLAFKI